MPKQKTKLTEELDLSVYTVNGTLRKRKPKTDRNYFTSETEEAILAYMKSTSTKEKNKIFKESINDSLYKLAECITNTFKFDYAQQDTINVKDIEHEVVVKLISEFHNYKQQKGKAYSYFGTVAKRFLIQYNEKQYKLQKTRKDLADVDGDRKVVMGLQEEEANVEVSDFFHSYITHMEKTINGPHNFNTFDKHSNPVRLSVKFTDKEKEIINCILSLFKNVEDLEIFYKPAFYLQIREITKSKTLEVTKVIKMMKSIMKEQMAVYHLEGELDIY